jgi:hypothetical protein
MQEKSVWCRAVPYLAHVEQEPGPSPRAPPPLSYLSGHWRLSLLVALNKDGSGPEKINVQRSPGSPPTLANWRHYGRVRQLRAFCLQKQDPSAPPPHRQKYL